ncbi:hypothetical protein L1987_32854 [Smallanthus sonchifolius]|uniref:Uncharacterized protein n=1 Tax=Smallanthus sonchifolius TaxID=185202 RepID=A0ACB9HP64_9ASTR|nr:hypothetical protein L1987_32854 [Smallanthus sonchifolius]
MEKEKGTKREEEEDQVVNPWAVSSKGKIDHDKLIDQFGCQRLDQYLVDRVFRLTSRPPHIFLRRNIFFAHRYLQDAFKVPLVIQLTDDEKCMWKNLTVEESKRLARENAKDIIACGFDISRTFIFSDFDYVGGAFYENMVKVAKCVTYNKVVGIFGFTGEDHIGKISFPPVQAVPSFPSSFPHLFSGKDKLRCLIPCAIDQGETGKMSATDAYSARYVTNSQKQIKTKVNKYDFSGGQDSVENHRKYGANLEEYGSGRILTGEVKKRLIDVLTELVERHQAARAAVTDENDTGAGEPQKFRIFGLKFFIFLYVIRGGKVEIHW